MGAAEAELGAATCRFGRLHSGRGGGRAPGRGRPELTGCLRVESASPSNRSEGARGRAQEGPGALEGASRTRAAAPLARHGGGGDLGPGLREDEPARRPVSARRCQRAVAGAGAAIGRMPVPHRLCAPVPQPPGPVCHAGGRTQPGAAAGRPPTTAKSPDTPSPSPSPVSWQ